MEKAFKVGKFFEKNHDMYFFSRYPDKLQVARLAIQVYPVDTLGGDDDATTSQKSQKKSGKRKAKDSEVSYDQSGSVAADELSAKTKKKKKLKDREAPEEITDSNTDEPSPNETSTDEPATKKSKKLKKKSKKDDSDTAKEENKVDVDQEDSFSSIVAKAFPGSNLDEIQGYGGGMDIGYPQWPKGKKTGQTS